MEVLVIIAISLIGVLAALGLVNFIFWMADQW